MRTLLIAILFLTGLPRIYASGEDREVIFRSGLELARQGRWTDAKLEFERGIRAYPHEKRFLIELGGIAYRLGSRESAIKYFQRAAALDPEDTYANDALGSLSLLAGRMEAAVAYWNRAGLPRVSHVDIGSAPAVSQRLMTRAVEVQPGGILRSDDLAATRNNLARLGLKSVRLELAANSLETYDLKVGVSSGGEWLRGPARLAPIAARLPYRTIDYEFRLLPEVAGRVETTFRWDPEKRLIRASFSGVPGEDPRWLFRLTGDAREENWDVRPSGSTETFFRYRQAGAGIEINRGFGSRFDWTNSFALSNREYSRLSPDAPADLFVNGLMVKETSEVAYHAIRPETAGLGLTMGARASAGRAVGAAGSFAKVEASAQLRSSMRNDSLVLEAGAFSGKAFGSTPFDELFQVGMERDNSLWLRGHVGTYEGRKGSAPLGSAYTLFQSDLMQTVLQKPFIGVSVGPFMDTATVSSVGGRYGSNGWMVDVGAESRVKMMNSMTFVVVWGIDTRTGSHVLYTAVRK